jgi:hypothetical protein
MRGWKWRLGLAFALSGVIGAAGCDRQTDIDEVPVGSEVQVTRDDGGLVEGRLQETGETAVKVDTGRATRVVEKKQIAEVRLVTDHLRADPPARAKFREVAVPADTKVAISLNGAASSETSQVEERIDADVAEPVVVDGFTVIPQGSVLRGVVSRADRSGKVKGRASLALHFNTLVVEGVDYPIDARFARTAPSTASGDAKKIGVPAIGGAVIGGIIGGKKGAAIGAAAGGGAGAAVVLSTPGDPVHLPTGTHLSLEIGRPIDVRVKLD